MAAVKKYKVPFNESDVTTKWLKESLELATKLSAEVLSLSPISDNAGLVSSIFKAEVKVGIEKKKLFIKIGAPPGSQYVTLVEAFNVDRTEVEAYTNHLPNLVEFEKTNTNSGKSEIEPMLPVIYAGGFEISDAGQRGMFLIMEDISVGYKMEKLDDGLSFKQLVTAMTGLARLHAVSYCYGKKRGEDFSSQLQFMFDKFLDEAEFNTFFKEFLERQVVDFAKHPKAKHLVPHVQKLSKNYRDSFIKAYTKDYRFMIHGDLWSNNMMFNHDGTKCKIFDWQFCCTASPLIDFVSTLYLAAKPSNLEQWMQEIMDIYYSKLEMTCREFNVVLPFTKQEMVDRCKNVGFFAAYIFFTMAYDPLCTSNPNFMDRFVWTASKALEHSPEFFDV